MTLIERVRHILVEAGYVELSRPFRVGSLPFEFSAAFIGRAKSLDLIIIGDLASDDQSRILQRVRALARALDLAKSRRPLTAVLLGTEWDDALVESISEVCRVLPVGLPAESQAEQTLRDWLAVLLPLPALEELSGLADSESELATLLPFKPTMFDNFVNAANSGSSSVEASFAKQIRDEVVPALQEPPK